MQKLISIPKPCNENWDNMTSQEQGRHCAKCNVIVQDFTGMSNKEIVNYLNKNSGDICARANEEQLSVNLRLSKKLKKFVYAFAVCILPLFTISGLSLLSPTTVSAQSLMGGIEGIVQDTEGEPIPFVTIKIHKNDSLVGMGKTNFKGEYKIRRLKPDSYTISFQSVGWNNKVIKSVKVFASKLSMPTITMIRNKNQRIGKIIRVGKILYDHVPGQQKISGDEIRNITGGN